jgi:hypothetical protein
VIANKFILLITAIGLTFGTSRLHAQGDIEAVNLGVYTGGVFSPYVMGPLDDGTLGWTFSPSQNIVIDSLGWMFGGTNSPSIPVVSVGLWSVDGTLLRSTVIDNNSVSINGNLYESIDPLFVSAGSTLVIGAGSSGDFNIIIPPASLLQQSINFVGVNDLTGNGFTFPTASGTDELLPAATFLFQTVPEPSVLGLSALSGLFLAWRRWKARAI